MEEYFSSSLNKNDHITEHHVNNVVEVMASKSTKASAKPAGKVKESKGTHKSTGPSLKDVDKLLKENEDLRTQLRVASGQVAYLRENLDPSAFRKAAGITAPDGNHLYDEALRSAEKIINKQKCELEELQRNKQGSAFRKAAGITSQDENHLYEDAMRSAEEIINKLTRELVELKRNKQSQPNEMDGKTRNEKDVSNDEIKRLKDENEKITKQAKADVSKLESELQNDVDGDCRSMANDFKNNIKRAALSLSENGSNVKETKIDVTRNNLLKEIQKSFAPLLVEDVYK
ncbi:hypothetical protein MAR_019160, partial [Mya arenaria]